MPPTIYAILLAAGRSTRMGQSKPLLPWGQSTVIESCVDQLFCGGVQEVTVVLNPQSESIMQTLASTSVGIVINDIPNCEMGVSISRGAEQLPAALGAILLALAAVAGNRKVIVSRGELVEIGGSFRVPEIMEMSGATLVEVGATNRTHLRDYEKALAKHGKDTGAILRVHRSNFRMQGFVSQPELPEPDVQKKIGQKSSEIENVLFDWNRLAERERMDPKRRSSVGIAEEPLGKDQVEHASQRDKNRNRPPECPPRNVQPLAGQKPHRNHENWDDEQ